MNKSDLVEAVSSKFQQVARKDVESIVDNVFDTITAALCRDERVELRGWGSFSTRVREARRGRNPKTGETIEVPRKRVPFFTVGKALRERIREQDGEAG